MVYTPDVCFLSLDQDTDWFFGIGGDQLPNLLFDDIRLYQLS